MSARQYRGQLERKRKQRIEAEGKAGGYRSKETKKRGEATKARATAAKTKSASTAQGKLREADRREAEAATAGKEAGRWQDKASRYAKEELALQEKVVRAEKLEADVAERRRKSEQLRADRQVAADRGALERRLSDTESLVAGAIRELRAPKPEKLRLLILGAASKGDLRVGREQKRIRAAVGQRFTGIGSRSMFGRPQPLQTSSTASRSSGLTSSTSQATATTT
jgi:hypothetical protein